MSRNEEEDKEEDREEDRAQTKRLRRIRPSGNPRRTVHLQRETEKKMERVWGYSIEELARYFQVTSKTLHRWNKELNQSSFFLEDIFRLYEKNKAMSKSCSSNGHELTSKS
jgi:hypothetical protein